MHFLKWLKMKLQRRRFIIGYQIISPLIENGFLAITLVNQMPEMPGSPYICALEVTTLILAFFLLEPIFLPWIVVNSIPCKVANRGMHSDCPQSSSFFQSGTMPWHFRLYCNDKCLQWKPPTFWPLELLGLSYVLLHPSRCGSTKKEKMLPVEIFWPLELKS